MKFTAKILIVMTLVAGATAKDKHNDADFVNGTLMGQRQVSLGTSCSGDDCSPMLRYRYTVVSDGVEYVLAPVHHGYSHKESVLSGQRPGTAVKMLKENGSTVYVKVPGDDRESRYEIKGTSLDAK